MKKVCILIAVLHIVIVLDLVFPQLAIDHHGIEFHPEGNCTFLSHSFIHMGIGLSFPTTLPLIGLVLLLVTTFLLEGFVSAPVKPPRSHF